MEIEPNLALKPEEEANKTYATAVLSEGKSLVDKGKIKEAIANYEKAQQIDPSLIISSEWNSLCWNGALAGFARDVMSACERAVALAPEDSAGECRDSRGLAKALTGDNRGAIEDFKGFVEWAKKIPDLKNISGNEIRGLKPCRQARIPLIKRPWRL